MDIQKLKKANSISRRMYLTDQICKKMGVDIYYLFGLLNMYNVKNRGRWFWQKAAFTGRLKDDFDRFNTFMDKFVNKFKSMDEEKINSALTEGQDLLSTLVGNLETNMVINREIDELDVRAYIDENMKSLIGQGIKDL